MPKSSTSQPPTRRERIGSNYPTSTKKTLTRSSMLRLALKDFLRNQIAIKERMHTTTIQPLPAHMTPEPTLTAVMFMVPRAATLTTILLLVHLRVILLQHLRRDTGGIESLRRSSPAQPVKVRLMPALDLLVPSHPRMVSQIVRLLVQNVVLRKRRKPQTPRLRPKRRKLRLPKQNSTKLRVKLRVRRKRRKRVMSQRHPLQSQLKRLLQLLRPQRRKKPHSFNLEES